MYRGAAINLPPKKKVNAKRVILAANFVATMAANVDNEKLTDAQFRELFRNTIEIVQYEGADDDRN